MNQQKRKQTHITKKSFHATQNAIIGIKKHNWAAHIINTSLHRIERKQKRKGTVTDMPYRKNKDKNFRGLEHGQQIAVK